MSELISYQLDDGIATLTLNNGKVNAISPDVIAAFNAALDQAVQDRAVVIITGQPGILSGGYDLKVMTSGPQNAVALVTAGSTLARRMLSHPFPISVACPGHAIAKGAFILLSAKPIRTISKPNRVTRERVCMWPPRMAPTLVMNRLHHQLRLPMTAIARQRRVTLQSVKALYPRVAAG